MGSVGALEGLRALAKSKLLSMQALLAPPIINPNMYPKSTAQHHFPE